MNAKSVCVGIAVLVACLIYAGLVFSQIFSQNRLLTHELFGGLILMDLFLIISLAYSITFIIFLITTKKDPYEFIKNITYDWIKNWIIFVIDRNLFSVKGFLGFCGLATIITAFSLYVVMIITTDVVISLIPATELVPSSEIPCMSVAEIINNAGTHYTSLILLIGPSWVFILRQVREYEIRNLMPKFRGAKILIAFVWAVFILFLAHHVFELGCHEDLPPGLYLLPDPPEVFMYKSFSMSIVFGGIVTLFVYLLTVFVIPRFRNLLQS